jgi:hypothetical protein
MLTLAGALVAVAPLLLHGKPADHRPQPRPLTCEVSEVRSPQSGRRDRFRATRIVDLQIEATLSGRARQERVLRLRVYTPRGFLYQVFELPLDGANAKRVFEARLPVAGTSIMASGLYGRWKVVPYLDNQARPCGGARRFTLRP